MRRCDVGNKQCFMGMKHRDDSTRRITISRRQAQCVLRRQGAWRERQKCVYWLERDTDEVSNIIYCYAKDNTFLGGIAYSRADGFHIVA